MSPIHTSSEIVDRLPPLGYKEVTFLPHIVGISARGIAPGDAPTVRSRLGGQPSFLKQTSPIQRTESEWLQ